MPWIARSAKLEILQRENFAGSLGAKLLLICPQCGTDNISDDKFCGECGYKLKKSKQKALANYAEKIKKDFGAEFKIRIGLNSGPVIVGSIGDDLRMDYTAVGDTSNLAVRIENMARPRTSLVSKDTYKPARDYFEFEPLGKMQVTGKQEPQEIFELIKTGAVDTRIAASEAIVIFE